MLAFVFKLYIMKLIYLSQDLDTTKEHELLTDSEFGFKVDIKMTEESWHTVKEDTAYNCTEVHHLWSKNYMGGASIVFESDIHRTGFTRSINDIEYVTIEVASKLYDKYRYNG